MWQFGSPGAESGICGPAGAFCRVAARRLAPQDSGLTVTGPQGAVALRLLRGMRGADEGRGVRGTE